MNVFTMPLLCADSGPWSKMSRAWPPLYSKTTSDTTCPSHQESAWRAAEARQEKVILAIVVGPLLLGNVGICVAHI